MRNLELWHVSTQKLGVDTEEFVCCYGQHDGSSSGELYLCTHNLIVSNFNETGKIKWSKALSESSPVDNKPVNITFLTLPNCVSVGLSSGELFTIDYSGNTCDLVGECRNGLLAMEWSPDQELLVLVTKDMQVIVMTSMFDAINECSLLSKEFGDKEFITVGWGKKETQFHGSEGKEAAKLKNEINVDPHIENNDSVSISWRGDGNLFAVGFAVDGIRMFKVFDREGLLQCTSEKQQSLESNLFWRPSGNLIATTQKLANKYTVSFFEKNGLKHGEFVIPVNATTIVEDLLWSSDSEILTLQCKDTELKTQQILLFTSSNYHWYLKQTLDFSEKQSIRKILWDNTFDVENNKKLHVILNNGLQYTYTWIWNINHSRGNGCDDNAVVTVIDGKRILATGFRHAVVPPPMGSTEIQLENFIQSIIFAPSLKSGYENNSNNFFACTSAELIFFRQIEKNPLIFEKHRNIPLDVGDFPFQYHTWHWVNAKTITCVVIDNDNSYNLTVFDISNEKITKVNSALLPSAVTRVCSHPTDESILYLQLYTGEIIEYNINESLNPHDLSFPVSCLKFDVLSIDTDLYFLGLTHKGGLYINETMVMNNVSSYFIHTNFLLLTTLKHLLLCTDLTKTGFKLLTEYEKSTSVDIYKRKIERGAKLVIAVPDDTRTVFQLPRGNLETIQPRPLSLQIIGKFLDSLQYHEAFDLMRKQRINLNLIYDHNPDLFMSNINVFIASIKNNSWLSLFLSELENIDVTKTMYSSSYGNQKEEKNLSSKVKIVCDAFETELRKDSNNKALPLLTTMVKRKTIEDLEKALSFIKQLKVKDSEGSNLPITSDEALKYLLYMVDVDKLFNVALGMYDFELVLLVANKSQKDPKEYIPMLNELNEMEENYKQFTINKLLKRYDKAVKCLVNCGSDKYGELKSFVKYHSLYREALDLFKTHEVIYKQISEDFATYLKLKKQYVEAGIIYERADNIEQAIECYIDGLEWELAIKLAYSRPNERLINICRTLAEGLKQERRHDEAIRILEMFCDDLGEAITYAIDCGKYKTALRLCVGCNADNVKEEKVIPALVEECSRINELILLYHSHFIKYKNRLSVVRENKNKRSVDDYDSSYINKDSDLYSDSGSTVASSGSSRSFRSSKNRRKHERKLASLKEGSRYEDTALIRALHTLIISTNDLRLPVRELNIALSCANKDKNALVLQTNLELVLNEMKDSCKEIWTNDLVIEATNAAIAAENTPEGVNVIPQGAASLEPHIRIPPIIQEVQWKLEGLN